MSIKNTRLQVRAKTDELERIHEAAKVAGYETASDFVRDLIAREMQRLGIEHTDAKAKGTSP